MSAHVSALVSACICVCTCARAVRDDCACANVNETIQHLKGKVGSRNFKKGKKGKIALPLLSGGLLFELVFDIKYKLGANTFTSPGAFPALGST